MWAGKEENIEKAWAAFLSRCLQKFVCQGSYLYFHGFSVRVAQLVFEEMPERIKELLFLAIYAHWDSTNYVVLIVVVRSFAVFAYCVAFGTKLFDGWT